MTKTLLPAFLVLSFFIGFLPPSAEARPGGGRSMGSRGSRGPVGQPSRPQSSPYAAPRTQTVPPYTAPAPQGGGFMRSLGAGLLGGFAGSMIASSLFGGSGLGGHGGGGIGLLEILLFLGLGYLAYRFFVKRRTMQTADGPAMTSAAYRPATDTTSSFTPELPPEDADATLKYHLPDHQPTDFRDKRIDDFYRVQAAFMKRDLETVRTRMTEELLNALSGNIQTLKSAGRINKLENIVVRNAETVEAWAEEGKLYATVRITAQMLDYTIEETNGQVVDGSATEPTRFEEYWTFVRDVGFTAMNREWRLTAIEAA